MGLAFEDELCSTWFAYYCTEHMFSATVDRWYWFLLKTINIRVKMVGYFIFLLQVWKNVIKNKRQVLTLIFNCVHAWLCA